MINLDNRTPKGRLLEIESEFLYQNMEESNGQEILYESMLEHVDFSFIFPAFFLTIPLLLLCVGSIEAPLIFYFASLIFYIYGAIKSISRLSFLDIFLFPLYYIFNKFYFIIIILLCVLLFFTGYTWAIPFYILLLILGSLVKESILGSYARRISQKHDIILSFHDIFLLRNLSRYAHNSYNLYDWISALKKYRTYSD